MVRLEAFRASQINHSAGRGADNSHTHTVKGFVMRLSGGCLATVETSVSWREDASSSFRVNSLRGLRLQPSKYQSRMFDSPGSRLLDPLISCRAWIITAISTGFTVAEVFYIATTFFRSEVVLGARRSTIRVLLH